MGGPEGSLSFADHLVPRPPVAGIDAWTRLRHFAILTYPVEPAAVQNLIHPRFRPFTVTIGGREQALLSVVPFLDEGFTAAALPFPRFHFGQTNYRIYVVDRATGRQVVWFLGTVLDSWTVAVPRHLWKLPWHPGRIRIDARVRGGRYEHYRMETASDWATARVELCSAPEPGRLSGFPDDETALVLLTHPLEGFYYRRDGTLGSYSIWHERLHPHQGTLRAARFDLLDRLALVPFDRQGSPHSVLLQAECEFTIYLPPRVVSKQVTPPLPPPAPPPAGREPGTVSDLEKILIENLTAALQQVQRGLTLAIGAALSYGALVLTTSEEEQVTVPIPGFEVAVEIGFAKLLLLALYWVAAALAGYAHEQAGRIAGTLERENRPALRAALSYPTIVTEIYPAVRLIAVLLAPAIVAAAFWVEWLRAGRGVEALLFFLTFLLLVPGITLAVATVTGELPLEKPIRLPPRG